MSDQELRLEILKIVLAFNAEQGEKGSILSIAKQTNYIFNYIKTGNLSDIDSKTEKVDIQTIVGKHEKFVNDIIEGKFENAQTLEEAAKKLYGR